MLFPRPDATTFVNGTGGTNLVILTATEVSVPDWYDVFPDRIASFFDKWVGAQDQWAYYVTLAVAIAAAARRVRSSCAAGSAGR